MSNHRADSSVSEIESLTKEIKRLNDTLKGLREQRKQAQYRLYQWMEGTGTEKYRGYSKKKLAPRERAKAKPKSKKQNDAINLFRQIGIINPEDFYKEFQSTQRYSNPSEDSE